jgi:hypothetical protein
MFELPLDWRHTRATLPGSSKLNCDCQRCALLRQGWRLPNVLGKYIDAKLKRVSRFGPRANFLQRLRSAFQGGDPLPTRRRGLAGPRRRQCQLYVAGDCMRHGVESWRWIGCDARLESAVNGLLACSSGSRSRRVVALWCPPTQSGDAPSAERLWNGSEPCGKCRSCGPRV